MKGYLTTITIEVISQEPYSPDNLSELDHDILEGRVEAQSIDASESKPFDDGEDDD